MLVVQDATAERTDVEFASQRAGLRVLQARSEGEAVRILTAGEASIDFLLVIHPAAASSLAAALIRKSLEVRPGLHVVIMADSWSREEMRAGYDAGAASIILQGSSTERFVAFLKQSHSAARRALSREVRRRERCERHASASLARRVIRWIQSWVRIPTGGRRRSVREVAITGAAAFLVGMGLAFSLERASQGSDRYEAMANHILEGVGPGSSDREAAAILRRQAWHQIGLTREANEASRRYYQDHLQELRAQYHARSSSPSELGAPPVPVRNYGTDTRFPIR